MKRLGIRCLCLLPLLLCGCKEYCPCYPQKEIDYLPVDYVGQTLQYLIDDDTVTFIVQPPEFSEKYELFAIDAVQTADATISASDNEAYLIYRKRFDCNNFSTYKLTISVHSQSVSTGFYGRTDYWEDGTQHYTILPHWTSPTGKIYTDVGKLDDIFGKNSAYFSPSLGLLHLVTDKGSTITLLP